MSNNSADELPGMQLTSREDDMNNDLPSLLEGVDLTQYDNNALVRFLDIEIPPEDTSKLLDTCINYTDLLPPANTSYNPLETNIQSNYLTEPNVLDVESLPLFQPDTPNLHQNLHQSQLIDHLVSECVAPAAGPPQVCVNAGINQVVTPTTVSTLATCVSQVRTKTNKQRRKQDAADAPKIKAQRKRRPRKPKVYEREDPFEDPAEERRRLNAINAKKNRDYKKKALQELDEKVQAVTQEKDKLEKEVEELKQREQQLREELASRYGVILPYL
ncbi:hypothetical protein OTU49_016511 [Cherax quadricarinatus]|uniref:BZIP domain-containing protein n=1 Tax=Cherax quadricarinatus TaxID=27406 RepID=A0AAW0YD92_CHEQU